MPSNVIREYLVALGFHVDNKGLDQLNKTMNDLSESVKSHTTGMTKSFVEAATLINGALFSVTVATAGLMDKVAQLDLGYQKFALHTYMAMEQAKQFKIVTESMGEDINDIAWIPELRQRYSALMNQARGMETPGDAEDGLKKIRDIRFEFTRMKVEATYALQWIGYYLVKYLAGPMATVQSELKYLNDWVTTNMPVWTAKVAYWIALLVNLEKSAVRGLGNIITALEKLWAKLTPTEKKVGIGLGALAFMFGPGPLQGLRMWIGLLGTGLLLLDDFYAYLDGKKSSKTLAPVWKELIELVQALQGLTFGQALEKIYDWLAKELPIAVDILIAKVVELGGAFDDWLDKHLSPDMIRAKTLIKEVFDTLAQALTDFYKALDLKGIWVEFIKTLDTVWNDLGLIAKALFDLGKQLHIISDDADIKNFWTWFGNEISYQVKLMLQFAAAIADVCTLLAQLAASDYKGAALKWKQMVADEQKKIDIKHGATEETAEATRQQTNKAAQDSYDATPASTAKSGIPIINPVVSGAWDMLKNWYNKVTLDSHAEAGARTQANEDEENERENLPGNGYRPRGAESTSRGSVSRDAGSTTDNDVLLDQTLAMIARAEGASGYDAEGHPDPDEEHYNLGGRYQILRSNWSNWCQQAGLPGGSDYTAENQEIVARYMVGNLLRDYNGNQAAVLAAWNGGEGGATSYLNHGTYLGENGYIARGMGASNSNLYAAASNYQERTGGATANPSVSNNNSNVAHTTIGDIAIQIPPGGDPDVYANAVLKAMNDAIGVTTAYDLRDISGIVCS